MEKIVNFIKSHPMLVGAIAVGVLLIMFWPSSQAAATGDGGAAAAAAISASQQANAQLQVSADQVRAVGIEAAAQQAINASNNAAAVQIAGLKTSTDLAAINAELAGLQSSNMKEMELGRMSAATSALEGIAQILPTTQANALANKAQSDSAGFQLGEMFRNLLNSWKGVEATNTLIATNSTGTIATVFGADGKAIDSQLLALSGYVPPAPVSKPVNTTASTWQKEDKYSRENSDSSSSKK